MKKFISIVLIALMLCAGICYADDAVSFDANLTYGMDKTSSEWYSSSFNRATLTWLLVLDYATAGNDIGSIQLTSNSYVGRDETILTVAVQQDNGKSIFFMYSPLVKQASALEFDGSGSAVLELAMDATVGKGNYYMNSLSDMSNVAEVISDAIK